MENKNNWGEFFRTLSTHKIAIMGKDNKEIIKMESILWLLICLFIGFIGAIFLILVLTDNIYFTLEKKA